MISVQRHAINAGKKVSVLFDSITLGGKYVRKIYVVHDPEHVFETEPHRHELCHLITVLEGRGVALAHEDEAGRTHVLRLEPGSTYSMAPNVSHQLRVVGLGVVETLIDARALTRAIESRQPARTVLAHSLFERAQQDQVGEAAP
jgi:hypothetical protein